jgi:hypothetical protein
MSETRVCKKCGRELSIDDFYWQDKRQVKRRPICRYCVVERIMRNKKGDQTYQVKHLSHPVLVKRKNRVPNGQGERSEYMRQYWQRQKERLAEKNRTDYIKRKLEFVPGLATKNNKPVIKQRLCEQCCNYPCFEGIENLESDFAKEGCHAFRKRENNDGTSRTF